MQVRNERLTMPGSVTMLSSVRIRLTLWYSGAMAIIAIAPEYQRVRRMRTELSIVTLPGMVSLSFRTCIEAQHVACPAPPVQQRFRSLPVNLSAQAHHI